MAEEEKKEQTPSTLWALLTQTPFPHKIVDFPHGDWVKQRFPALEGLSKMAIVPIVAEEVIKCHAAADDFAKDVMKKNPPKEGDILIAFKKIFDDDVTVRVLYLACRDPLDVERKIFPGPQQLRQKLTLDQIGVLAHQYMMADRDLSVLRSEMTKEEMDGFLDRLAEGGREAAPLGYISLELLRDLLMRSVSRLSESRLPSTSSGSPPTDGSSGTPSDPDEPAAPSFPEEAPVVPDDAVVPENDFPKETPLRPTYG